jgi:hypothetical protein
VLWDVSALCAVVPPPGLYGVVGTGVLWDVSTLCALAPPPGLYGVLGTGVLWHVSTLCAVAPAGAPSSRRGWMRTPPCAPCAPAWSAPPAPCGASAPAAARTAAATRRAHTRVSMSRRYSDEKVRIETFGISGGRSLTQPVSRRPPISLDMIVSRTHMYTYAAKVWDLSIVQGPVSVAQCHT